MKTKIDFGKIDGYGIGRRTCRVTVKVELNDENVFTASADIWNSSGTDLIRCGQCLDYLYQFFENNSKFKQVYEWWEKWHLKEIPAEIQEEMRNFIKEN